MLSKLRTVNQLVAENPALTTGGLRWDIFNADSNGLHKSGAIIRKGRKILIDPEKYLKWLQLDSNDDFDEEVTS